MVGEYDPGSGITEEFGVITENDVDQIKGQQMDAVSPDAVISGEPSTRTERAMVGVMASYVGNLATHWS